MEYLVLREAILQTRPELPIEEVDRAYVFAKQAHEGQTRYSGEPYILHPVAATHHLLRLHPDLASIQACLMHDVTEDTPVKIERIEKEFGKEVATLVLGLEKLAVVKTRGAGQQDEKWQKMFLAMAKDLRIVFIKLSDRLHNMQTLAHVPREKQERIARETLGVHAAIASRLGIYDFKSELEDLAFEYLYPLEHAKLALQVKAQRAKSQETMEFAMSQVEQLLAREALPIADVQGRFKHLYSIFQKMQRKGQEDLNDIYDVFALRVILKDQIKDGQGQIAHLYGTLGILHANFLPLQDRFKDYVAVPKPNGYRSLHTTVFGLGGVLSDEPMEVQIRTESMHREAEIGIASHAVYKLGAQQKEVFSGVKAQMNWLKSLAEQEPGSMELDLYPENIFVLTPRHEVVELPRGATPIDFAYSIHSDLGNKLAHAKANGKVVPLDYQLKNGQMVEVGTRNNATPSRYWIGLVKTGSARMKIKNWFNRQDKESNTVLGRNLVNEQLALFEKPLLDDKFALLKNYAGKTRTFQDREQLLELVGLGTMSAAQMVKTLHPEIHESEFSERPAKEPLEGLALTEQVLVTGEENLPVVFSACCKPKSPDAIIGYVTRGHSIRIHRQSCRELAGLEGERFVSVLWKPKI